MVKEDLTENCACSLFKFKRDASSVQDPWCWSKVVETMCETNLNQLFLLATTPSLSEDSFIFNFQHVYSLNRGEKQQDIAN